MTQMSLKSCVWITLVALFGFAASSALGIRTHQQTAFAMMELRDASIELQQARLRVRQLEENGDRVLLQHLGEHVSVLQIRLADFLSSVSQSSLFSGVTYEQVLLPPGESHGGLKDDAAVFNRYVNVVRLNLTVRLSDGDQLIQLLTKLRAVLGGWPVNIRGCDVRRMPAQALESQCVLDVYHWKTLGADEVASDE